MKDIKDVQSVYTCLSIDYLYYYLPLPCQGNYIIKLTIFVALYVLYRIQHSIFFSERGKFTDQLCSDVILPPKSRVLIPVRVDLYFVGQLLLVI